MTTTSGLAPDAPAPRDVRDRVLDALPDAVAVCRCDVGQFAVVLANAAAVEGSGLAPRAVAGAALPELIRGAEQSGLAADLRAVLAGTPLWRTRYRMGQDAAGRGQVLEACARRLDDVLVLVTWRDVTDAVEGERMLERAYEQTAEMRVTLQMALDATSDCFAVYQLERAEDGSAAALRLVHANAAAAESLGRDPDELVGQTLHELFPEVEVTGLWDRIVEAVVTKAPQHHRVHRFDADGGWLASWDNAVAPVGEERLTITWRDASAEERALRQLARHRDEAVHSATHDALTGLPNRILLRDHLGKALTACPRGRRVGVVFVDLDGFKAINDTYGHAVGDAVLRATADRLRLVVRQGDLAARLAGDEFVLVLAGLPADWEPEPFFARATARLAEPVAVEGTELRPGASLGVVLHDPARERIDAEELIKSADAEMYRQKALRRAAR